MVTFWYRENPASVTEAVSTNLLPPTLGSNTISVYPSELNINFSLTQGSSTSLSMPLRGRSTWREVSIPFIAATSGTMQFEVDYAAALQDVQIAGMQLFDYGQKSVLTNTPNVVDCTSQFSDLTYANGATCTESTVSVSGNSFFTQAEQLNVTAGSSPVDTNVFIASNLAGSITNGDTLVVIFWVCRDPSSNQGNMGLTGYYLQQLSNNKIVGVVPNNNYSPLIVDGNWQQYCIPITAGMTLPANGSRLWLVFGQATQVIDVAGIQVIDLGTAVSAASLTHNELHYPGRELSANWQATAATNIQKYRTGVLTVNVTDGSGSPLSGTSVKAAMTKHAFDFGTWSSWADYLGNPKGGQSSNPEYQNVLDYYSGAGIFNQENNGDYKWPVWAPGVGSSPNWTIANQNIYLRDDNITDIRGHNLIWPNYRTDGNGNYVDVPSNIPPLSGSALSSAVLNHIDTECTDPTVMSYITNWDVVNEPWTSRSIQAALANVAVSAVTPSVSAQYLTTWINEVAKEDPVPTRFINDDGVELNAARLTTDATNTNKEEGYDFTLLSDMISQGAQLEGYGFESHFQAPTPYSASSQSPVPVAVAHPVVPPVTEKAIFDNFASLTINGNPLLEQITEFDPQYPDQTLQADYMSDYLTLAFSEPNFNAFCLYGFWGFDFHTANSTTVPGSSSVYYGNVYNSDWSISPSGEAWLSLVYGRWWTNTTVAASQGVATVNGYLGRYALTATNGGITKTFYASLPTTAGATANVKLGGSSGSSHVWLYEAENSAAIYAPFYIAKDSNASNGEYITSSSSMTGPPVAPPQQLRIDMEATGTVNIWLRVLTPTAASSSFVAGIDASPSTTINLPVSTSWTWYKWQQSTLSAGSAHQLRFNVGGYGTQLDEVLVTDDLSFTP